MEDMRTSHIDPVAKWSYPLVKLLAQDLNFSYSFCIVDNYGWSNNQTGRIGGLIGMLDRKELDFGWVGILMRNDRIPYVDFTAEIIPLTPKIMFRRPPLSSVSNIFILPFSYDVWMSCFVICAIIAGSMGLEFYLESKINNTYNPGQWEDIFSFIMGTICQQGSDLAPTSISLKTTMFITFIVSLFLFTSYSATIIALLQSPSTSIKTIDDLTNSPLKAGFQNLSYNQVFLKESDQQSIQRFYQKKILPQGDKGFLPYKDGMKLLRSGMYAFQCEIVSAYKVISDTFTEQEKCGLEEIEIYRLPSNTIPVQKHSPYRDLFTQRLRWQKEVGIIHRTQKRQKPPRPKCEQSRVGYVSVGLIEFGPALNAMLFGQLAALIMFLIEVGIGYIKRKKSEKLTLRLREMKFGYRSKENQVNNLSLGR